MDSRYSNESKTMVLLNMDTTLGRISVSYTHLYNVYGRENAYTITFKDDPDDPSKTLAEQTALFKWVPSITYNFNF